MHEISAPTLSETGTKLRRRRSPHAYDNPKIFSLYFHILYRYPNGMSACNWRRKAAVLEPLAYVLAKHRKHFGVIESRELLAVSYMHVNEHSSE